MKILKAIAIIYTLIPIVCLLLSLGALIILGNDKGGFFCEQYTFLPLLYWLISLMCIALVGGAVAIITAIIKA